MLRAEVTTSGVAAVSGTHRAVTVDADGWQPESDPGSRATRRRLLPDSTVDAVEGRAAALELPDGPVSVDAAREERSCRPDTLCTLDAASGPYVVSVDSAVTVHVVFSGDATLDRTHASTRLAFGEPTDLTVGIAGRDATARETVVVPKTPDGVATALSAFPAGHLTATADRSRPEDRGRPPLVAFGEATAIPERVENRRADTEVTIRVPPDLRYLLTVASLSHYLGAAVVVDDAATPTVRTPTAEHALGELPDFQYEAARLLRRVFFFDCLVRSQLPGNEEIAQSTLLDRLALDAGTLGDAPPHERFAAYLDAPFDLVAPDLPDWHLSMYLEPTYDHVETLPHVLQNLPNVFLPKSRPLEGDERLTRSLDDFYRASTPGDVSSVEPVKPLLGPGQSHGWLAEGIPIDVFKSVPEAYENRRSGGDGTPDGRAEPASVAVVLNDARMTAEHEHAADIYRRGTADLDIDVTVQSHLSRDQLATVFEANHDLVHYIGHCEEAGLRCQDGHLSTSSLSRSGAETFFLNACGSYFEGLDLVQKGSVAGAVTFEKVLDGHAARVGTSFVRLLVDGFSIERALELARRRIIMGTDYAVVGDGTHRLSGANEEAPVIASITEVDGIDGTDGTDGTDDQQFRVAFDSSSPRTTGGVYRPPDAVDDQAHLTGSTLRRVVPGEEMDALLGSLEVPVVFDGDIHWADDLRGTF